MNTKIISQDPAALFSDTYEEARAKFLSFAKAAQQHFDGASISKIEVPSLKDADLTIDVYYQPARKTNKNLLIMASAVHGIEGYAGSALQSQFLKDHYQKDINHDSTGVLLIHAVNPYGFKNFRRVTENNVDLNRNFDISGDLFLSANDPYLELDPILNPKGIAHRSKFNQFLFTAKLIKNIFKVGKPQFRQAVLQGQYQKEAGIFFGGKNKEFQVDTLNELIKKIMPLYEQVLPIDIHTGYGVRGKLHLLQLDSFSKLVDQKLMEYFEGFNLEKTGEKDFYRVKGSFMEFVASRAGLEQLLTPIAFEFGTNNSHTTAGGIAMIKTMAYENQSYHHGFQSEEQQSVLQAQFKELFYPQGLEWIKSVQTQFAEIMPVLLKRWQN